MPKLHQLDAQLDRLAGFQQCPFPVISLYLNLQPDEHGRDRFGPFLRKELAVRLRTYPKHGPERRSLEQDADRIQTYVEQLDPSANGLALFACSGAGLFETAQLAAPLPEHRLFISHEPHLYPLARVLDEYPRYLALITDTHSARIFVFALNEVERTDRVESEKTKHHKQGGWSQARYQRHVENYHLHHAKEVVDTIVRIVREERIDTILIAGDDAIAPLLREYLPKEVAQKVVGFVKPDAHAGERDVLAVTLTALREKDAQTDRERVDALIGAFRANGLACVGVENVRNAFERGQVDELLITAVPNAMRAGAPEFSDQAAVPSTDQPSADQQTADQLITRARHTSAKVRFIEDPTLLARVGGVGALLRFRL
jgi:peptide subunit release factor 1 (eRF1)